jgi:competence protein ComEA
MKRRTAFALTVVAMLLSAALVMAQGSAPGTSGTTAKGTKPAAGTVAKSTAAATTPPAKAAAATAAAKPAPAAAAAALVDLNSASKADLMKLPGIGEAISAKIIAGRPWANKSQLLAKSLVSKPAYDKLSALVIAKQAK